MTDHLKHLLGSGIGWVASAIYDFACWLFRLANRLDPDDRWR